MTASARGITTTVGLIASDRQLTDRTRQAALELGVDLHVFAVPRGVTFSAAANHRPDCHDSLGDLIASAAPCDVVTFESSAISAAHRAVLYAAGIALRPSPQAAELADDSATARQVLHECGFDVVPIPDTRAIDPPSRQHGNTATVRRSPSAAMWVGELNVVVARRPSGLRVIYPVVETGGGRRQLDPTTPAATPASTAQRAVNAAISIADGIDATGILTVEFLLDIDKRPYVNSVLLGPHPQPHPISDPANASQFENHLRAILDWPLRATTIGTPTP